LKGGIIDKDVDCAERIDGFPSYRRAYALLSDVTGEQDGFASPWVTGRSVWLASVSSDK